MSNPKISIIIPTLNEEEGIAKTICSIPEEIRKEAEIINVDVSNDYTPIIAEKLGARVIKMKKKGKGRQIRQGAEQAKGEILVFMDGDGTDSGEYIPQLLKKLKKDVKLVLGCRSMKEFKIDNKEMRIIFLIYGFFMKNLFGLIDFKVSDPLAGFRVLRKKDWEKLKLTSDDFKIETEMNIKAMKQKWVIKEVAIPHLKRCGGGLLASKLVFNPQQWFEISKIFLKHFKEEKIISKIKKLESKLKSYLTFKF